MKKWELEYIDYLAHPLTAWKLWDVFIALYLNVRLLFYKRKRK